MQTPDHLETVNLIGPRNRDSVGLVIKCHVIICNFLPNSENFAGPRLIWFEIRDWVFHYNLLL